MPIGPSTDTIYEALRRRVGQVALEDPVALGLRVRAALVLSGRELSDVAEELNISVRTLARVMAGNRQLREWELQRLAALTETPEWFLREGFAGQPKETAAAPDEQLQELKRRIDALLEALGKIGEFTRAADVLGALLRERPGVSAEDRPPVPTPRGGHDVPS
jgi:transcriptional regulator with XRE-family HTH domain